MTQQYGTRTQEKGFDNLTKTLCVNESYLCEMCTACTTNVLQTEAAGSVGSVPADSGCHDGCSECQQLPTANYLPG